MADYFKRLNLSRLLITIVLLLACVGLEYYFHIVRGMTGVYPHLFYVPIFIAAFWWGFKGGLVTGILLSLLHLASYLPDISGVVLAESLAFVLIGSATGIIGGERIRTEEALRESEELFRQFFENEPEYCYMIAPDGTILDVNSAALKSLGYTKEQLVGKPLQMIYAPESLPKAKQLLAKWKKTKALVDEEMVILTNEGNKRIVLLGIGMVKDKDGKLLHSVSVQRDITDRKKAEEKLKDAYEKEAKLREHLESQIEKRIEFTRALVHELKTPLTPLMASSELLVTELHEEPLLSLAKNVNRGACGLNDRIDELLDLARGEIGMLQLQLKPVDLLKLLHTIADDVTSMVSSYRQSLVFDVPLSLPYVYADEDRLRQVVLNLVSNACKFTPDSGTIILRAREKDTNLVVEIQDTGPGIAEGERQRLFEPYHRLETDRERLSGLGLGLALCKTLVELHGGQIWVESRAGEGSTFSFSVPLEAGNSSQQDA